MTAISITTDFTADKIRRYFPGWFSTRSVIRFGAVLRSFLLMLITICLCSCASLNGNSHSSRLLSDAHAFFSRGDYQGALHAYEQAAAADPVMGDRALFEMGIIHAHPGNEAKDFGKALDCFRKLVREYPHSVYRHDSSMMVFYVNNMVYKEEMAAGQQLQIRELRQKLAQSEAGIKDRQQEIAMLEQKVKDFAMQKRRIDRVLITKQQRQLSLYAGSDLIKTYRVAMGGNPVGPKLMQGDKKTPEGIYTIDSKNRNSRYHQALHISYPNADDRKRAKALGAAPGGDIMIHGIKKGYAWVGSLQADLDWTQGCIAVTDEEIEEIFRLVPIGTVVEIRP